MKKVIIVMTIIVFSLSVGACSQKDSKMEKTEKSSQEKVVDTTKITQDSTMTEAAEKETEKEEIKIFQLNKDNKVSTAKLYIQDEAIFKEEIVIEGPFSTIGVNTKEEAEKTVEQLEEQMNQIEGMNTYYTVSENQVIYVSETDYEKVDLDFLGITEDMMLIDKQLPKASIRIQDYEGMCYKEVK